ncbi:hypothetical protein NDU88_004724 [Pleurodeles waltl]|uniref:Uncharacterized protein n=1 Tax=Pleurodeles waltl TaxID=8319 RepID=A0AAV7L090_PLEWA|nr:hypothetical protein NDU88_004724 [Pleurodeles waltl]
MLVPEDWVPQLRPLEVRCPPRSRKVCIPAKGPWRLSYATDKIPPGKPPTACPPGSSSKHQEANSDSREGGVTKGANINKEVNDNKEVLPKSSSKAATGSKSIGRHQPSI